MAQHKLVTLGGNEFAVRLGITQNDKRLSFNDVFNSWKTKPEFVDFYSKGLLAQIGNTFFWEHPPLLQHDLDRPYEVILHLAGGFEKRKADPTAFHEHFSPDKKAIAFDNLGKNARLIVPTHLKQLSHYKHLGIFLENANKEQIFSLFREVVGEIYHELSSGKRIWLNTSGLGIIWLHIRLDTHPKYYKTKRYKMPDYFENI
ncbi:MAG: hypothetical protein MRZ79_27260 [Bacteroidia bacterium]|nr:hypothetical protein [Bacteroidia bacterium]